MQLGLATQEGQRDATMRITAISLRRRPDRWSACEEHLRAVLPPALHSSLDLFAGTDAKACIPEGASGEAAVAALEERTGCTVYRGWPITEVADVRRCYPDLAAKSDAAAWVAYERACAAAWRPDRARLYVDFFHRHLTLGDVGAALSHLRVAERAHAEGVELQLVLEDDVRLTPRALPELQREIDLLGELGVGWDMIYLHSADYGRRPEPTVHPDSALRYAGHRKASGRARLTPGPCL